MNQRATATRRFFSEYARHIDIQPPRELDFALCRVHRRISGRIHDQCRLQISRESTHAIEIGEVQNRTVTRYHSAEPLKRPQQFESDLTGYPGHENRGRVPCVLFQA
jgi:hypothetical protein